MEVSGNFSFLASADECPARLGAFVNGGDKLCQMAAM